MRAAPCRLRCEYLNDPLGIDTGRPRLSWWLNDPRPAELQTGYQIQAASTVDALTSGTSDLWDTGRVASQQTSSVEYRGEPLGSRSRVWWRVRCYDSDGTPSPWSDPARFEVGVLSAEDWRARWIAAPLSGSPATAAPAPVLYRDIELPRAPRVARLYLAVLGSAAVEINGRSVSEHQGLEPWSDLRRRVPYRVWDVTGHLHGGRNRLAVILGDGDYCGHLCGGPRQRYGTRPALCAELVVELTDGRHEVIGSDTSWRWSPSGVLQADRDRGEEVDGRQFRPGWSVPGTAMAEYPVVQENMNPECFFQSAPPAVIGADLDPVSVPHQRRADDGRVVLRFDFGRLVLGRVRIALDAEADTTLAVRYGTAAPAGDGPGASPGASAVEWSSAVDRYTARGGEGEAFEPRFSLHAFRWIEICLDGESWQVQTVSARELVSAADATAGFECDHRLLQELFAVADRTLQMGLAVGPVFALASGHRRAVTADCEAILAGASACRDAAGLFRAWLSGLADILDTRGRLPPSVPASSAPAAGSARRSRSERPRSRSERPRSRSEHGAKINQRPAMPQAQAAHEDSDDLVSLLPALWLLYRCYGDHRLLERLYPAVQRFLAGFRDRWPEALRGGPGGDTPLREQMLATAWYCYALSVATRVAGVLGRLADLESYEALAERVAVVFRERFLTREGVLVADDQLGYLLALELGLLEGAERATALARLEFQLRRDSFHPDVDARHGALLLEVLTLEGRSDLAYQLLLQTTPPSWLHPLTGEGPGERVLNDERRQVPGRLAAACVIAWLQRFLLGLELDHNLTPEVNAYRRMRIQPRPPLGREFAAGPPVREASGHLDTVHGRYECRWRITAEAFVLEVRVPGNCSASVILPDGSAHDVVAGSHTFTVSHEHFAAGPAGSGSGGGPGGEIPVLKQVSP